MINDLVLSKKKANALREEISRLKMIECERPEQEAARDQSENDKLAEPAIEESNILDNHGAKRLKRGIQQERAKLLSLRQNHAAALRESTGLRELLRLFCQATRSRIERLQSRKARPMSAAAVIMRQSPPPLLDGNLPPRSSHALRSMTSPQFDFWSFAHVVGKTKTHMASCDNGEVPIDILAPAAARPLLSEAGSAPQQSRNNLTPNQVIVRFEVQLRVVTRLAQLAFAPMSTTAHDSDPSESRRGIPLHHRPQSASIVDSRVKCVHRRGKMFVEARPQLQHESRPEIRHITAATRPASAAPTPRYSSLRRGADGNAVKMSVHVGAGAPAALACRQKQCRIHARPVTR